MKQYKHKQTGELAIECSENGPLARYKINHGFIAAHFVENTQDWEEILPDLLFITEDGEKIYKNNHPYLYYVNIHTNAIGIDIENSLWAPDTKNYKYFVYAKNRKAYLESIIPKLLYTTEDGVEIYNREDYSKLWGVGLQCTGPEILKAGWKYQHHSVNSIPPSNRKWFYSKEKAEQYIILNLPYLSIKDVLLAGYSICNTKPLEKIVEKKYDNK